MRGWLVIHNHFFANTADISHRSSTSEMGVLQEFPISWRGVPEMVLSGSRGGGFTYVRDWAPAVSLLCSKLFLGLQAVCPGEEASTALLEDASCPLRLSWCPLKLSWSLPHSQPLIYEEDLGGRAVAFLFPFTRSARFGYTTGNYPLSYRRVRDSQLHLRELYNLKCQVTQEPLGLCCLCWHEPVSTRSVIPAWSHSDYTNAFAQALHTGIFISLAEKLRLNMSWLRFAATENWLLESPMWQVLF